MSARAEAPALDRREVAASILARRGDALVVAGLGAPCFDTAAAGDHALNFYVWGAMGSAAMIGLGLALAQPRRRVIVITGDGELLMGLGSLATIGVQRPDNLALVVMDNEHYGETGMQAAHTGLGVDLALMAKGAGFAAADIIRTREQLHDWVPRIVGAAGPLLADFKVTTDRGSPALPPRDGPVLRYRFRQALLGDQVALE
ncbi:MAG: aldehyde dehydrogenase [Burkholderiales bacterium]|nr:aldehyde dehydrogenase [Burkholderiales bacterium]